MKNSMLVLPARVLTTDSLSLASPPSRLKVRSNHPVMGTFLRDKRAKLEYHIKNQKSILSSK